MDFESGIRPGIVKNAARVRWLVIAYVLLFVYFNPTPLIRLPWVLALMAAMATYNLLVHFGTFPFKLTGAEGPGTVYVTVLGDILLVTVLILLTGGAYSQFYFLYFLILLLVAVAFSLPVALAFTLLISTIYFTIYSLRHPFPVEWLNVSLGLILAWFAVTLAGYYLVGEIRRQSESYRIAYGDLQSHHEEVERLSQRLKRALTDLSAIYKLSRQMVAKTNPRELLDMAVRMCGEVLGAESVSIMLLDKDRGELTIEAAQGLSEELVKNARVKVGERIAGWVVKEGKPLLLDQDLSGMEFRKFHKRASVKSSLCAPLVVGGEPIGALNVTNKKSGEEFTRDELELLTSFAEHVAVVLQRNVLLSELEENRRIQERLTEKIINAQEEERKRIALAIHDSVVQLIASTLLRLDACEARLSGNDRARAELYKAKEVLNDSLSEVRRLISDLRPVLLDDLGLIPALRKTAEEWGKEMGVVTEITVVGPRPDLPKSVETALFRIVQEALTNVKNHARATRVDLKITSADGRLEIKVRDNGMGFDPQKVTAESLSSKNIGFESMQERAKMCGGGLEINSAPGKGTEVKVVVPL